MSAWLASHKAWVTWTCVGMIAAGVFLLATRQVSLLTPDQRAFREFARGDYEQAAGQFTDTRWKGVALFRQGEFKQAAALFAGRDTADSSFNRGNALLMQGQYDAAARAYSRALELRPDWDDAVTNREIAQGRAARLRQEGGEMTGGMLGADEIVFDTGDSSPSAGEEQVEGGQEMGAAEINALWLRQVQTKPADFLAAKFSYQYATQPTGETEQGAAQ